LEIEDARCCNVIDRRRRGEWTIVYVRLVDDDRAVDIIGRIDVDRHGQQQRGYRQLAKRRVRGADRDGASGLRPQL